MKLSLFEFASRYSSEEACRQKFKEYREKVGVVCPHCGCTAHYWIGGTIQMFQCKECGCRQSLRSHTVMHASKLPFRTWFVALYLVTQCKSSISTKEVQRQLSMKQYRPVWCMVQKIRNAMCKSEFEYKLSGEVEIDEAFFNIHEGGQTKDNLNVLVMTESISVPYSKKYSHPYKMGKVKLIAIPSISAVSIREAALASVDEGAILRSDGATAHRLLKRYFDVDQKVCKTTKEVMTMLPYAHIVIGRCKDAMKYVYKDQWTIDYVQNYLCEFSWKMNHRYSRCQFDDLCLDMARYPNDWYPAYQGKVSDLIPAGLELKIV